MTVSLTDTAHATCRTVGCPRRGRDALPTLGACPGCSTPLSRFKGATAATRPLGRLGRLGRLEVARAVGAGLRAVRRRQVQIGAASTTGMAVVMFAPWPVAMSVPVALYAGTALLVRRGDRPVREHCWPAAAAGPSGATSGWSYFADVDQQFSALVAQPVTQPVTQPVARLDDVARPAAVPARPVHRALSERGAA